MLNICIFEGKGFALDSPFPSISQENGPLSLAFALSAPSAGPSFYGSLAVPHLFPHKALHFPLLLLPALLLATPGSTPASGLPLRNWLLVGPFPNPPVPQPAPNGPYRQGWNQDFLAPAGGEANPQITEATLVPFDFAGEKGVADVRTARTIGEFNFLDLNEAYRDRPRHHRVAYAYTTVTIPGRSEYTMLFGADDAAKIWLNGTLVYDGARPGGALEPRSVRRAVNLRAGENTILVKIDNDTGDWSMAMELATQAEVAEKHDGDMRPPPDFTSFDFAGLPDASAALSDYLWHFFRNRIGNPNASFYVEYMMTADIYLGGALTRPQGLEIQELKRQHLKELVVNPSGYVQTHQHYSHAHDHGWPFPFWPQQVGSWEGLTYGWHWENSGQGWMWQLGVLHEESPHAGIRATEGWELEGLESRGIVNNAWELEITGRSPALISPEAVTLEAFNNPWMQLRWSRESKPPHHQLPYLEWKREGDADWSPERRLYIPFQRTEHSEITGHYHSHLRLYDHPLWKGKITRLRLKMAPGESEGTLRLNSFFSVYDTRKPYNNLKFINAAWTYFTWTGDIEFLGENVNRLRLAYRYFVEEFEVPRHGHPRIIWPGHDGLPGWYINEAGEKVGAPGHGIGNNYYDLLPFGWDDMYLTAMYYKTTLTMAEMEEAIRENPQWGVVGYPITATPEALRRHAEQVARIANDKFWNPETGRFVGAIDADGNARDYGYTFVALESIYYGIASDDRAKSLFEWIDGERIVQGDTSTGGDIYAFEFGPRASTRRNIEWYGQGWVDPAGLKFGEQIQDGGAVLGFSYYDIMARLKVNGPDDAFARLLRILEWEQNVQEAGGYRAYYEAKGITLQGGGTAGGLGIDFEFLESSLLPAVVPHGFLGLQPSGDRLVIDPKLPSAVPSITVRNLKYRWTPMDITAEPNAITFVLKAQPAEPIAVELPGNGWRLNGRPITGVQRLPDATTYRFTRTVSGE